MRLNNWKVYSDGPSIKQAVDPYLDIIELHLTVQSYFSWF